MTVLTEEKPGKTEWPGLTTAEAAARLSRDGHNELPGTHAPAWLAPLREIAHDPMFLLLVACGILYWLLGDAQEAYMLLGFVVFIMGLSLYQGHKTERALEALRDMSSPRALVVRDGIPVRIAGRDVVVGDLLMLAEGDRVPADAVLVSAINMHVDEALLTGEAVAVRKACVEQPHPMERPGGDDRPCVFSGTLVVKGRGTGIVQATGASTEMGRIGKALQGTGAQATHLQRETGNLVRVVAIIGLALCVVTAVVYGATRSDWLNGALVGLTLAMAIMPNELPVVLTIFLALGAWRMAQRKVLTRGIAAVEALGAATVLCVDKTGTLTVNRMTVTRLSAQGESHVPGSAPVPSTMRELLECAGMACQPDATDPMDSALLRLSGATTGWTLKREYALTATLLSLSNVWYGGGDRWRVTAKGAPESMAALCHLPDDERAKIMAEVDEMAADGLRVLGVAVAEDVHDGSDLQDGLPDEQHAYDFRWLGLVGLADPIRATVPQAVKECYEAGIRVIMVTGDYASTAQSIARDIGLANPHLFLTGADLQSLDAATLRERLETTNIFCRVLPEQKLQLVNALREAGEVVAMTGDGVNDAPALRAADIGIAMGGRGSDVAREAASIVLLDDDFDSIVAAVKRGRCVYANLKGAMAYLFGIHLPIVGLSVVPVICQWPLVLLPVHIAFLHLIIDPACSVVFEAEPMAPDIMRQPPRDPKARLFGDRVIHQGLLQGTILTCIVLAVFLIALARGQGELDARALTFTTLVIANVGLMLTCRATPVRRMFAASNPALWWVVWGALALLGFVLAVPGLQSLFKFAPLHLVDLVICATAGLSAAVLFELAKGRPV